MALRKYHGQAADASGQDMAMAELHPSPLLSNEGQQAGAPDSRPGINLRAQRKLTTASEMGSLIGILVAALPWAVIAQPIVEPRNFSNMTTFNLAAISSSLAVIVALGCAASRAAKDDGPEQAHSDNSLRVYFVGEAYTVLLSCSIFFFFMTVASYSLVVGLVFASLNGVDLLATAYHWCLNSRKLYAAFRQGKAADGGKRGASSP